MQVSLTIGTNLNLSRLSTIHEIIIESPRKKTCEIIVISKVFTLLTVNTSYRIEDSFTYGLIIHFLTASTLYIYDWHHAFQLICIPT